MSTLKTSKTTIKTTEKDFKDFQKYCLEYREKLGLGQWEFYFQKKFLKDRNAETHNSVSKRKTNIILSTQIDQRERLQKIALHEVLHVVFANLTWMAMFQISREMVEEEEHMIINHLIKLTLNV